MRRIIIAVCAAAALAGAAACAGTGANEAGSRPNPGVSTKSTTQSIRVRVHSTYAVPVRVRVVSGSEADRLGTVEAAKTATFRLPHTLQPLDVRFQLTPVDEGGSYETHAVSVSRGDVVVLRVARTLPLTTVSVRSGTSD